MRAAGLRHQTRVVRHQQQNLLGRRHGSRTPGPLEARRRATKRKYAASTAMPGTSAPGDLGTLFALTGNGFRVQEKEDSKENRVPNSAKSLPNHASQSLPHLDLPLNSSTTQTGLPLWLKNALNALNNEAAQRQPDITLATTSIEQWRSALDGCESLDDIRAAAKHLTVALSDPMFSQAAFEHLNKRHVRFHDLCSFLSDRSINPPAACNPSHYLRSLDGRMSGPEAVAIRARDDAHELGKWMFQEIILGSMTEVEIRDFLRWTARLQLTASVHSELYWMQVLNIYEGLKTSSIRPLQQTHASTIRRLLRTIAVSSNIRLKVRYHLARDLIKAASEDRPELCPAFILTFSRAFLHHGAKRIVHNAAEKAFRPLQLALTKLPADRQPNLLRGRSISQLLDPVGPLFQVHWFGVFSHLAKEVHADRRDSLIDEGQITNVQLKLFSSVASHETVAFLLQVLPPALSTRLFNAYFEHTTSTKTPGDIQSGSSKQRLLARLDGLPQSQRPAYIELLAKVYSHFADPAPLEELVLHCNEQGYPLPILSLTELVNSLARTAPSRALSLFLRVEHLRVEYCVPLVASIIASPSISNDVVFSLTRWSMRRFSGRLQRAPKDSTALTSFLHQLGAMLSENTVGSAAQQADMLQRLLEMFEAKPELVGPNLVRSYVRAHVRRYLEDNAIEERQKVAAAMERFHTSERWIWTTIEEEEARLLEEMAIRTDICE